MAPLPVVASRALVALIGGLTFACAARADPIEVLSAPRLPPACDGLLAKASKDVAPRVLLGCFAPTHENTSTLDVAEVHVRASQRFFVDLPSALDPKAYDFLRDPAERARAVKLLNEFFRWKELDEEPVDRQPTGEEAPFRALHLTCGELDALGPSSLATLVLLEHLKQASACPRPLTQEQQRRVLTGSSLAMERTCRELTDEALNSDVLRSAILRAVHFDRGHRRAYPGSDACLARLAGRHAVAITESSLGDGTAKRSVDCLGSPKTVFALQTSRPQGTVRVFTSDVRAKVPEPVRSALAKGVKPASLTLRMTSEPTAPVCSFVITHPAALSDLSQLVVVDADGTVTVSEPW